jgi:phage terminase large subunit-like protein
MRGEVYGCAAEKKQASIAFDVAIEMIDQNPTLKKRTKLTLSQKKIEDKISKTIYQVLSAEAYSKHGYKVSAVLFDELHCQPNRSLWDIMTFGAGDARKQPLWWVITTAGDDPDKLSIGYEIHEKATKILSGEIIDPRWYCEIYGLPDNFEGDIYDEELWYKINPSLGHTIDIDKVRQAAIGARNSPAEEKLFRWLRLNQWVSLKKIGWLDLTLWDSTVGSWNNSELIGKKCYAGLDLASTTDLTGLALLFPPQDGIPDWRFIIEAWIPEANMKERIARDHVPYDRWVQEKVLHATAGNTCDYDFVKARIETLNQQYDIKYLCCDPWNSRMLTQQLEKTGMEVIEVAQTISGLSPGMKELERLLKSGNMTHEKNQLARWCFGNVVIACDGNNNLKPMKNKSRDRIDPIVALVNAMNIAITQENVSPKCPYSEERGILML